MRRGIQEAGQYVTKDGSIIRELVHPCIQGDVSMSLAEATVLMGGRTSMHVHSQSEEIYHILQGSGMMRLGPVVFEIGTGDSILIKPGTPHFIENTGSETLRILCCCHPPYDHEDTCIVDDKAETE